MRKTTFFLITGIIATIIGSAKAIHSQNSYLGEEPPGPIPKIFAPDIISNRNVVGGSFTPDRNGYPIIFADGKYLFYTLGHKIYWVSTEIIERNSVT